MSDRSGREGVGGVSETTRSRGDSGSQWAVETAAVRLVYVRLPLIVFLATVH